MRYATVHEDLIAAFPELAEPHRRLVEDWLDDDEEDEPPGQYIVFGDTLGTLIDVTLGLPARTPGRDDLLRRAADFGERLLAADDREVANLGIDVVAERLGSEATREHGGPLLQAWFDTHGSDQEPDEIIDLWGVRPAMASLVPDVAPHDLPGISAPMSWPAPATLDEARAAPDGAVMLLAPGAGHPLVVARAAAIGIGHDELQRLAEDLAAALGQRGGTRVVLATIPRGERVWTMHRTGEDHGRLWDEPWLPAALEHRREFVLSALV